MGCAFAANAKCGEFTREIQGNVLRGFHTPAMRLVFVRFEDAAGAREWLRTLPVTSGEYWPTGEPPTEILTNVAISSAGLAGLGVAREVLERLPTAFRQGMWARRGLLADPPHAGDQEPGLRSDTGSRLHAVVALHGEKQQRLVEVAEALVPPDGPVRAVHHEPGLRLADNREHFGYRDGISQPIRTVQLCWHSDIPISHFLIFPDADENERVRRLLDLGTFLVFRKLRQDVPTFRRFLQHRRVPPERVAALLTGRWRNGAPVEWFPEDPGPLDVPNDVNDFDYSGDSDTQGTRARTSAMAHIRRANPRRLDTGTRRLIRRAIPYGPPVEPFPGSLDGPVPEDDGIDRGLLFLALNADLEGQFEFIQRRWMNGRSFGGGDGIDPFGGTTPGDRGTIRLNGLPPTPVPAFVHFRGGEYFLIPSIGAIEALAAGDLG